MDKAELSKIRSAAGRKGGLKGGKAKVPKGFSMNRELARAAGRKGRDAKQK